MFPHHRELDARWFTRDWLSSRPDDDSLAHAAPRLDGPPPDRRLAARPLILRPGFQ
jgi:hypothetical protein